MLLIFLFVVTGFAVRTYHNIERGFARGEEDLRTHRAETALTDSRQLDGVVGIAEILRAYRAAGKA
jgi:hypothetical protein